MLQHWWNTPATRGDVVGIIMSFVGIMLIISLLGEMRRKG